jgi:hypothetical protein
MREPAPVVCARRCMVVWLFPYLPLANRLTIGPWTLIPRGALEDDDSPSAQIAQQARGVAALYRLEGDSRGFGAFPRTVEQPVGEEFDGEALSRLHQTVLTAMLDENPSQAGGAYDEYNAGHRICTTENGLLFGHGVGADGYTAYSYGTMVQTFVGGPRVGEAEDVIDPPHELKLPLLRPQLDPVYADALYQVLSTLTDDSADLPGAIRWLEVGWSNSRVVSEQTRILAFRAGFDVLFGDAATARVRQLLSALLDDEDAERTERHWVDHGNARSASLTELEWWFQSFALLRNRIAHGGRIDPNDYVHDDDVAHVWHAEFNLRRSIKKIVADAGYPAVLLDPFERVALEFGELLAAEDVDEGPGEQRATQD